LRNRHATHAIDTRADGRKLRYVRQVSARATRLDRGGACRSCPIARRSFR